MAAQKIRFEVFKRDGFSCQYCGRTPPVVVLQLDHIHPVSKGGKTELDNLITACFDCNIGKSNRELTALPQSVAQKAEIIKEREAQLRSFRRLQAAVKRRETLDVQAIESCFKSSFPTREFTDSFRDQMRRIFLQKLPKEQLEEDMHKACYKFHTDPGRSLDYFCGICWNRIKGRGW